MPHSHTHTHRGTHMCAKDARFMAKKVMGQSSWLSLWLAEEAAVKVAGAAAVAGAGAVCEGCGVCLVRGLPAWLGARLGKAGHKNQARAPHGRLFLGATHTHTHKHTLAHTGTHSEPSAGSRQMKNGDWKTTENCRKAAQNTMEEQMCHLQLWCAASGRSAPTHTHTHTHLNIYTHLYIQSQLAWSHCNFKFCLLPAISSEFELGKQESRRLEMNKKIYVYIIYTYIQYICTYILIYDIYSASI